MKHTGNMIVMGFLVVGLWYAIGYVQGSELHKWELDSMYEEGVKDGEKNVRDS